MPLDADHAWERSKVVPAARILEAIDRTYPLEGTGRGIEPATTYRFADGAPGAVGVIASVTEPFCDTCSRLRLTAGVQEDDSATAPGKLADSPMHRLMLSSDTFRRLVFDDPTRSSRG